MDSDTVLLGKIRALQIAKERLLVKIQEQEQMHHAIWEELNKCEKDLRALTEDLLGLGRWPQAFL